VSAIEAWIGVDVGKEFHWAVMRDAHGEALLSHKVSNVEADLVALIDEALAYDLNLTWAVDLPGGAASLLLALLWARGQRVIYVPGIAVDRARDTYRGESKTDARDAAVIADHVRMRRDLSELKPSEDVLAGLQLLVSHRRDLVADQTRAITRLRDALLALFPGLERTLDLRTKGALQLVAHYQTAGAVRRAGRRRVETYLRARGVRNPGALADKAVAAAKTHNVELPAQDVAATIVADLATQALTLKDRIALIDEEIETRFFCHPQASILVSLPGMGPRLGAEFLVAVGDQSAFDSADRLAAYAGLVPAARDSGKRTGNLRRMHGGNKMLKRVCYQAAFASLRAPESRSFYDRKRSEGKRHHQAVIALARRRVNVLWAMLRDETLFTPAIAA
jgi:transposase